MPSLPQFTGISVPEGLALQLKQTIYQINNLHVTNLEYFNIYIMPVIQWLYFSSGWPIISSMNLSGWWYVPEFYAIPMTDSGVHP